ncbi:helix-turn-helix transcriptional regulator [Flavobacterium sp. ov086]|uniref:helix-turn-helix transcriptional regulator n=1 Tax=Flavobacterium sp. ov086 TaxID=1761785 RepID=UPI000B66CA20|nr:helix-turn-helix transcriptional regulator [Flavobacterium sp. ov086]SNR70310.1 Transcriptional regulator, contains XRE-family HTH domain [Flavobacterium sp. ov086]
MNVTIGNRLKQWRKAKNMSQEEVADCLHISQSTYARMERGESTSWATYFNKICKVFEINPEDLVKDETESARNTERLTEIAMLSVYRKIIKRYELQIDDLKTIIRNLNKGKN